MEISPESYLDEDEEKSVKCKLKSGYFYYFLLILIYVLQIFVYYFFVFPGLFRESRIAYSVTITVLLFFSLFYSILTKIDDTTSLLPYQKYPIEQLKFCPNCNCRVPIKAYHCNECNKCRIFYDHHNKLLGTCISKANYRYYMRFILSFVFADMLIASACFNAIFNYTKWKSDVLSSYHQMRYLSLNDATFYTILFICIVIFTLPFLGYFLIQAIRIALNQRYETASFLINYYRKPPLYYYEFTDGFNWCCACCTCCGKHRKIRGTFSD